MKKKTAAAIATNWITSVMKAPYRKTESLIVKVRALKSGFPITAAMIGITRLSTSELMTAANARPMTNATASSIRLPFIRKSLNSCSSGVIGPPRADFREPRP